MSQKKLRNDQQTIDHDPLALNIGAPRIWTSLSTLEHFLRVTPRRDLKITTFDLY
jgi:hypothetical protein